MEQEQENPLVNLSFGCSNWAHKHCAQRWKNVPDVWAIRLTRQFLMLSEILAPIHISTRFTFKNKQ